VIAARKILIAVFLAVVIAAAVASSTSDLLALPIAPLDPLLASVVVLLPVLELRETPPRSTPVPAAVSPRPPPLA
jgi:hypothetical protein